MSDADLLDSPDAGAAAIRGGALRVVGYIVGVLLSVGSAAVLFRHLGVDDGGDYVLALSIMTLSAGLTDAGLSSIGVRELSIRRGAEREDLLRNLMSLRIAFSLAGIAVGCAYAALTQDGRFVAGAAIAGVGILIANVQNTAATVLMAELRLAWVTIAELLRQVVNTLAIFALALAGAGLLPFFVAAPAGSLAALALTVGLVRSGTPLMPRVRLETWRRLLADTLPVALAAAVGAIYFRLAILFVDLLSDSHQTGLFGASFRVVEVLTVIPQLVVAAALPIFSRAAGNDAERLRYGLQKMVDACLLMAAFVVVGLGVGAPVAIEVVAGPDYDGAEDVLRLHALALGSSFMVAVFGYGLLALRLHRQVLMMNACALAVIVVGLAILVPLDGARGGAAATVCSELALALSGALLLRRAEGAPHVGAPTLWRLLLIVAIACAPALLLPALPAVVLSLLLLTAGVLALRVVPEELLVELRSVGQKVRRDRGA